MNAREMKDIAMNITECTDREWRRVTDGIRRKAEVGNYGYEYSLRTTNQLVIAALTERLKEQGFTVEYHDVLDIPSLKVFWGYMESGFLQRLRSMIAASKLTEGEPVTINCSGYHRKDIDESLEKLQKEGYTVTFDPIFGDTCVSW